MGYENVEDRYASDVTFCDRVHGDGRGLNDCIFDDMMAFANLPDPPRTRTQVSAGVAANAEHANCPSKLIYMSQPAGVDGFPLEFKQVDQGMGLHVWATCFQRDRLYRINWSKELLRLREFSHGPESSRFLSMGCKDSWTSCSMKATFPWRSKTLPGRKSRV